MMKEAVKVLLVSFPNPTIRDHFLSQKLKPQQCLKI